MHRVALVTPDYFHLGGTRTMTQFLATAIGRSGVFEPTIISLATSKTDRNSVCICRPSSWRRGVIVTEEISDGQSVLRTGTFGAELEFMRYRPVSCITDILSKFDIVQFVAGIPPWACIARNVRCPVFLWTATTTRADRESRLSSSSPARRFWMEAMTLIAEQQERKALNSVDEIFALSDYSLASVRKAIGSNRGVLAPCGVDTAFYQPSPHNENDGQKYIVCVGRLDDARKNVRLLIEAYQDVVCAMADPPQLWLVGPEPPPHVLAVLKTSRLQGLIKMIGPRSPLELARIYRDAIFFVMSSDEEGLGIVLLEAMASGLPIVSTACGGPKSVVEEGETGILVKVGDRSGLAMAMIQLASDPVLRSRMALAARKRVLHHFSINVAGEVFLKKYEQALQTGQRNKALQNLPIP